MCLAKNPYFTHILLSLLIILIIPAVSSKLVIPFAQVKNKHTTTRKESTVSCIPPFLRSCILSKPQRILNTKYMEEVPSSYGESFQIKCNYIVSLKVYFISFRKLHFYLILTIICVTH